MNVLCLLASDVTLPHCHPVLREPSPWACVLRGGLEQILTLLCTSTGLPEGFNTLSKQEEKENQSSEMELLSKY